MQGGMQKFMQQAQQMQKKITELKENFSEREFEATSGGGAVTAVINGDHELQSLDIDPAAVDPEDTEMLEEMIIGAVNQASNEADDTLSEEMEQITGGMNLPGIL